MKNTENNQREYLEILKKEKIIDIFQIKEREKLKKENSRKKKIKIVKVISLLLLIFITIFLLFQYKSYMSYIKTTKNDSQLAQNYKEHLKNEEEKQKNEIKLINDITLDNIQNIPEDKKELLLNLIPSEKPLKKEFKVNSTFGMRVHPVSRRKKMHNGVDLKLNTGDDVIATAMGKVVFAGRKSGSGKTVVIEHFLGFRTVFAHLDKINVKVNEIVGKGKVIAQGGNTGVSTGPHLHYEVKYNGKVINPQTFMDWDKNNFNIVFEKEKEIPWESFLTIIGKN